MVLIEQIQKTFKYLFEEVFPTTFFILYLALFGKGDDEEKAKASFHASVADLMNDDIGTDPTVDHIIQLPKSTEKFISKEELTEFAESLKGESDRFDAIVFLAGRLDFHAHSGPAFALSSQAHELDHRLGVHV